jgi:hypothetical protein
MKMVQFVNTFVSELRFISANISYTICSVTPTHPFSKNDIVSSNCYYHTGSIGVPRNIVWEGGELTNSVEDSGQREWGSGGVSPLVRCSAQFSNE